MNEHSELSPMKQEKIEKVSSYDSDDVAPKSEEEQNEAIVKELAPDYVQADDAMHVDFNENQWCPCIPGLGLSLATIICAVIGAGIGCAIAFSDGKTTMMSETMTEYMNMTAVYDDDMDYDMVDVTDVYT